MATSARRIAVIFGMKGGMSDVGKFAAAQAAASADVDATFVGMYSGKGDGPSHDIDVDITQEDLREKLKTDFKSISFEHVDIDDPKAAQEQLEGALEGVSAVVACLASRQPGLPRWLAPGTRAVTEAMKARSVARLVHLSSFGIGDDGLGKGFVPLLWAFLLNLPFRAVKKDLIAMEDVVLNSGLDYVLVRPVGLDPSEQPRSSWKTVASRDDGKLSFSIAKADVAAYMLKEAVEPSVSKAAVTLGQPPK